MTATEIQPTAATATPSGSLSRMLLVGTGFGIEVGERNLELAVVRSRPGGPKLLAAATVHDFRSRPAAEWGSEILAFLTSAGEAKLPATVLLPRAETIVRTVALPGVTAKETAGAIALQIDTLHPYGDDEVAWGWMLLSPGSVLTGLVRKEVLDSYETLFAEAGIPIAAVTFSAAALHSALRLWSAGTSTLLAYRSNEMGRIEVYGESEARPAYSAEFPVSLDRALAVARGELRLAPDTPARTISEILPVPASPSSIDRNQDGSASSLAYAAAITGSVPRRARVANLLPADRRASHGRLRYVVPAILATALIALSIGVFVVYPAMVQKRLLADLTTETKKLEPRVKRVQSLDVQAAQGRARIAAFDMFSSRAQADLDVLNELSRLLPAQVWTSSIEIFPDSVTLVGEADQAAPLLKLLDASPLFQNSEFGLSVTRNGTTEQFRIKTMRRGRTGRPTP